MLLHDLLWEKKILTSDLVQVFDVVLNGDHTIIPDLDIFSKVGRGVAHDEYVSFSVINGKLTIKGEESDIRGGKIRVEFIKVTFKWDLTFLQCLLI